MEEPMHPIDMTSVRHQTPDRSARGLTGQGWTNWAACLIRCCALAAVLGIAAGAASDADESGTIPANAHPTDWGDGWECDRGYRRLGESCAAIDVPDNAYLDASGRGWNCERGFRAQTNACVEIPVPEHGYLSDIAID